MEPSCLADLFMRQDDTQLPAIALPLQDEILRYGYPARCWLGGGRSANYRIQVAVDRVEVQSEQFVPRLNVFTLCAGKR